MHLYPIRDPHKPQTGAGSTSIMCSCADARPKATRAMARTHGQCFSAGLPAQSEPRNSVTLFSLHFFFFQPLMIMTTCPRFCGYEKNHISCMSKHNHNALGRQLAREEQRGEISLNLPTIEYFMVS